MERSKRRIALRCSPLRALIEEVADGGHGRADQVFVIPRGHRARQ
jgi:hypothetical protein